jgi:tetratricopeptide (TPR) repeat protein
VQSRLGRRGARASFFAVAAWLALGLTTPRAQGQEADAAVPTESAADVEQIASRAYELQVAGRYGEAIAAYLKAYELSSAGAALLNVATIYDRRLHDRALAADYYRRYVRAPDADPPLVERANGRLAVLERGDEVDGGAQALRRPGEAEPASAIVPAAPMPSAALPPDPPILPAAPAPAPPPDLDSRSADAWKTLGLVVGGAGVASVGVSLVLGALAMVKNNAADMMCNGSVCPSENGVRLAQDSGRLATASTIAFFAGLALAGGGITIVLAAPKARGAASGATSNRGVALAASPTAGLRFAGLDVQGAF